MTCPTCGQVRTSSEVCGCGGGDDMAAALLGLLADLGDVSSPSSVSTPSAVEGELTGHPVRTAMYAPPAPPTYAAPAPATYAAPPAPPTYAAPAPAAPPAY